MSSGVAVGIQARMSSSRLPGKVLMDIAGKPMIQRVWEACEGPWRRVVLTSADKSDDGLCAFLERLGAEYRRGDLGDVLSRYEILASEPGVERVIRVCGDAPLIRREWLSLASKGRASVFIPGVCHAGGVSAFAMARVVDDERDIEHAGYFWFQRSYEHIDVALDGYFTVNTREELERARKFFETA